MTTKLIIMGAAGKDFHVFNTCYRDNEEFQVVAFTAAQIPDIEGRKYPAQLAGSLYPEGIPILAEEELTKLIKENEIDEVIFAYSDVKYDYVKERENIVKDAGAKFRVAPVDEMMIKSEKPVIAVTAVRTGCGKSQTTRRVIKVLQEKGKKVVAIRHPMPYGDLVAQEVQRFGELADLEKHKCTIEEMEEYEPHIKSGIVVYAGVDYGKILKEAEKEADVIVWDGGNNDLPFYKPDLHIVVTDPFRAGHEISYYPGDENFRRAHTIIINKMDSAEEADVQKLIDSAKEHNPNAQIMKANSAISVTDSSVIEGKNVLVVEDGPTLTHGEMKFGAGVVAAKRFNAKSIVDPRPFIVGTIKETFEKYPGIGDLIPAMGYGDQQIKDLQESINATECDSVVIGTPIDLSRLIKIDKPSTRVAYELEEIGDLTMPMLLEKF